MVDDEGLGGDFDGGEAEAEGIDVPVGERVGIVRGDYAFGQLGVGVVDPVENKVVVAGEAGVVLDGMACGVGGEVLREVLHGCVEEGLDLSITTLGHQNSTACELDAGWEGCAGFGFSEARGAFAWFDGPAGDGRARNHVGDEMAAVGEHGLQHLPEHWLLVEGEALLLPLGEVCLGDFSVDS